MNGISANDATDEKICVCVLNTCAVTTKAEQKARRIIRLLLKKFPNAAIIVTGCYAQLSPKEIRSIDERVVALPGLAKSSLREIPEKVFSAKNNSSAQNPFPKNFIEEISNGKKFLSENSNAESSSQKEIRETDSEKKTPHDAYAKNPALDPFIFFSKEFVSHSRASLKIQDGCDNSCSYCAIHLARGKSVSLEAEAVVERVNALEEAGHAEVVLTGVNVGQYAGTFGERKIGIAELLSLILSRTKKSRFAFRAYIPKSLMKNFAPSQKASGCVRTFIFPCKAEAIQFCRK